MTQSKNTLVKTWEHVSASQIKTFTLCHRKWYYDKIVGLPRGKPSAGAARGSKHHKEIEQYLKYSLDERTQSARVGAFLLEPFLDRAPFNGGDMLVETRLVPPLYTVGGKLIDGAIDVYLPGESPIIIDHKFRGSLELYGDKPEDLREDEQVIIYSQWAFQQEPKATEVEFRIHQHQTQGAKYAEPVSIQVTRDEILKKFGALSHIVDKDMTDCSKLQTDEVRGTRSACKAFGGCEFASICPVSSLQLYSTSSTTGGSKDMSFFDNIVAKAATQVVIEEPAEKAEKTGEKAAISAERTTSAANIGTLYIDCYPSDGANDLNLIIAREAEQLALDHASPDIRLSNDEMLGFGRWKATLAQRIIEVIDMNACYYVNTGTLNEEVIAALRARFSRVVRVMR